MKIAFNKLFTGVEITFKGERKVGLINVNSEKYNNDFNYQNPIECQNSNIQKHTETKKRILKFRSYPVSDLPLTFFSKMAL